MFEMRDTLISILAVLAIVASTKATDINKNGFNFYKDYLRAKSDDVADDGPMEDRTLYFYRTPLALYPGLMPNLELEYKKRTGNAFKNHMLSKEQVFDGEAPRKRSSKTALSFLIGGKHPFLASRGPVDEMEVPQLD